MWVGRDEIFQVCGEFSCWKPPLLKKGVAFPLGQFPEPPHCQEQRRHKRAGAKWVEEEQGDTDRSIPALVGTDTSHQVPQASARAVLLRNLSS